MHTSTVTARAIDRINFINIALMIFSMVIASLIPCEMFLIAYAVLGPLHYLTEISWLHDRKFFSKRNWDWVYLIIPVIPTTLATIVSFPYKQEIIAITMTTSVFVACALTFSASGKARGVVSLISVLFACAILSLGRISLLFTLLLPTLVHVYLFTGIFMLQGAIKGRSRSGLLSVLVFVLCPLFCLYVNTTPSTYQVSEYVVESINVFSSLHNLIVDVFRLDEGESSVFAFMRLMAFAYTYHYLNWFSKTEIINWHQISRERMIGIVLLYGLSLTVYAINFQVGFFVLFALSLTHVVLEFPLNVRAIVTVYREGRLFFRLPNAQKDIV